MTMKNIKTIIILLLISQIGFAQQIGEMDIEPNTLSAWNASTTGEYQGVYQFGFSEAESLLFVYFADGVYYAQIKWAIYADESEMSIKWTWENIKNFKVVGNKFTSDKTNGEFLKYKDEGKSTSAIKVSKSWTGVTRDGKYEVGLYNAEICGYLNGKFSEGTCKLLRHEMLKNYSFDDLKILRNEIYARYGLTFKAGGEMEKYFKAQTWYAAQYTNVDKFLTELEKKNIQLILELEKLK